MAQKSRRTIEKNLQVIHSLTGLDVNTLTPLCGERIVIGYRTFFLVSIAKNEPSMYSTIWPK